MQEQREVVVQCLLFVLDLFLALLFDRIRIQYKLLFGQNRIRIEFMVQRSYVLCTCNGTTNTECHGQMLQII